MTKIVGPSAVLALVLSLLVFATHGAAQDKPLKKIYWGVSTLSPTLWIPWIAKEAKIFERRPRCRSSFAQWLGTKFTGALVRQFVRRVVALPQVMLRI